VIVTIIWDTLTETISKKFKIFTKSQN